MKKNGMSRLNKKHTKIVIPLKELKAIVLITKYLGGIFIKRS